MNTIRSGLVLAVCAITPLVITGCTGDDKDAKSAASSGEVASPAPAAKKLMRSLGDVSARVAAADDAFARVVADSVTDPEERLAVLDRTVRALDGVSALALGEELKTAGADVVAGWRANANAIADADLRRVAVVAGDEAKAGFDAAEGALRDTDRALNYHLALLRDARAALGSRPNSTKIVAARPSAVRIAAAGKKADNWLAYASRIVAAAGRAPVPAPVAAAPATPEPVKAEPAPASVEAPATKPEDAAKPAEAKSEAAKPASAAVEIVIEHHDANVAPVAPATPGEPQPKPTDPDPIPDPAK